MFSGYRWLENLVEAKDLVELKGSFLWSLSNGSSTERDEFRQVSMEIKIFLWEMFIDMDPILQYFLALILDNASFKHFDWLLWNFQPIRVLKPSLA